MKFKIVTSIPKTRVDLPPITRLFVFEIVDYGIEMEESWVEFPTAFYSIDSAKEYAAQYRASSYEEEFEIE